MSESSSLNKLARAAEFGPFTHVPLWSHIEAQDLAPAMQALLADAEQRLQHIEQHAAPNWQALIEPIDRINHEIGHIIGPVSHLLSVKFSDELQAAFDSIRPDYVAFSNRLSQSTTLYEKMKQLKASSEWQTLSEAQQRVLTESLRGMERAGVHLGEKEKTRFEQLSKELAELSNTFGTNLVKEEKDARVIATTANEVAGIPDALTKMAAETAVQDGVEGATAETGPWHFVVNGVNLTVITKGDHRAMRERFYRAFRARGTSSEFDNRGVVQDILNKRQELAALVGFDSYADYSIDSKMAESVDSVWALLAELETAAKPVAQGELQTLTEFAREQGMSEPLAPWDVAYWSERLQEDRYGYDAEELRAYFQLPKVMEGLFTLMKKLYDVDIVAAHYSNMPTWDDSVEFYEIRKSGQAIAGFYIDPYARPGEKRGGAWMNTVVDKSRLLASDDRSASLPVALFVMNARPPADGQPGLMSLDEVRTLFHEFGHVTQHVFTQIDEDGACGLNLVEWDAVELASQFNEYWMDHKPFLRALTEHVETGQPLDDATLDRIIASTHFMAGNATLRQLQFGKSDLLLHQHYGTTGSNDNRTPFEIEQAVAAETTVLPRMDNESQLPAFGHLFAGGYAAGYYSYKWAEVLAADAFGAFHEVGLDNEEAVRAVAQRFADTVLALGGSRPAAEVYRAFRGRDATPNALLSAQGLR